MSTVYENAVDTLRDVGGAVRDIGDRIADEVPSGVMLSSVEWPEDLVDRVACGGRSVRNRRVLYIGGAVALIIGVAWFVRRRRSDDVEPDLRVADRAGHSNAA